MQKNHKMIIRIDPMEKRVKGYKQIIHIKRKSKYENIFNVVKEIKAIVK